MHLSAIPRKITVSASAISGNLMYKMTSLKFEQLSQANLLQMTFKKLLNSAIIILNKMYLEMSFSKPFNFYRNLTGKLK